eukprot:jgi/Mesvir1/5578/Mv15597-RA.2
MKADDTDSDSDSDFISIGVPIVELDDVKPHQRREVVKAGLARNVPVWQQEATDEQGRRRFHGAFTGGFSAGYFNTVGSKEGWTPATFVSSRADRAGSKFSHSARDYMDADEVAELEARDSELATRSEFDTFGFTGREQASSAAAKEASRDASAIPGGAPLELLTAAPSGIGERMLRAMGWRAGRAVGQQGSMAAMKRRARRAMLALASPLDAAIDATTRPRTLGPAPPTSDAGGRSKRSRWDTGTPRTQGDEGIPPTRQDTGAGGSADASNARGVGGGRHGAIAESVSEDDEEDEEAVERGDHRANSAQITSTLTPKNDVFGLGYDPFVGGFPRVDRDGPGSAPDTLGGFVGTAYRGKDGSASLAGGRMPAGGSGGTGGKDGGARGRLFRPTMGKLGAGIGLGVFDQEGAEDEDVYGTLDASEYDFGDEEEGGRGAGMMGRGQGGRRDASRGMGGRVGGRGDSRAGGAGDGMMAADRPLRKSVVNGFIVAANQEGTKSFPPPNIPRDFTGFHKHRVSAPPPPLPRTALQVQPERASGARATDARAAQPPESGLPKGVEPPADDALRRCADKLAEFVLANGAAFEELVRQRQGIADTDEKHAGPATVAGESSNATRADGQLGAAAKGGSAGPMLNPLFRFLLPHGEGAAYYRWRLEALREQAKLRQAARAGPGAGAPGPGQTPLAASGAGAPAPAASDGRQVSSQGGKPWGSQRLDAAERGRLLGEVPLKRASTGGVDGGVAAGVVASSQSVHTSSASPYPLSSSSSVFSLLAPEDRARLMGMKGGSEGGSGVPGPSSKDGGDQPLRLGAWGRPFVPATDSTRGAAAAGGGVAEGARLGAGAPGAGAGVGRFVGGSDASTSAGGPTGGGTAGGFSRMDSASVGAGAAVEMGHQPFAHDPAKQARYEAYLRQKTVGGLTRAGALAHALTEEERAAEVDEFEDTAAMHKHGHHAVAAAHAARTGAPGARRDATPGGGPAAQLTVAQALIQSRFMAPTGEVPSAGAKGGSGGGRVGVPSASAAAAGLDQLTGFGRSVGASASAPDAIVREEEPWGPAPLLCKRLGVQDPYRGRRGGPPHAPVHVGGCVARRCGPHGPARDPGIRSRSCWLQPRWAHSEGGGRGVSGNRRTRARSWGTHIDAATGGCRGGRGDGRDGWRAWRASRHRWRWEGGRWRG